MGSIVGFSLFSELESDVVKRLLASQEEALAGFNHLERKSISLGTTSLEIWGHKYISDRIHTMPDGSLLALIGSPHGKVMWPDVQEALQKSTTSSGFQPPWDGRVVLLHISADGRRWTMWNDWLGSIPVFYTSIGRGRVASTLEPVVVASAGYTPDDFFLPGLVSLLINGHFIADWTLYKDMKVVPPDSAAEWDENGFRAKTLWTVEPSQSRWEAGWDDLVDEMHELSRQAVKQALSGHPKWILPLSSGLDSRLIAGVAADADADVYAYAWGASHTTDVVNSQKIARALGFPWKHIDLPKDFLVKYTPQWAAWFGSAMHFHGMYQMSFLDEIRLEPAGPVLSGFIGDVLAGSNVITLSEVHSSKDSCQIYDDWHVHWAVKDLPAALRKPVEEILPEIASAIENQINVLPGKRYQNLLYLALWSRQRFFTNFQSTLLDYWRGVANPFMNRAYARFCMSLPRAALDERRLLADVFRRYYGSLAVIPGTYAKDPFILTGSYLVKRRLVEKLPPALHRGPLKGFGKVQLRMDIESVQAIGRDALWPLFEAREKLSEWLDFSQLERDLQTVMSSQEDIRPLRRLQSAQTLAYRLLGKKDSGS
jgi:hypothetical protein